MRLALCTNFLSGDIWKERLWTAAKDSISAIDEYGSVEEVIDNSSSCDAVVIALKGVAGLQAVRKLREMGCNHPLLWIADEEDYALFSYRYRVTFFLLDTEEQNAIQTALIRLQEVQREQTGEMRW